jgi:hypothetical protein
VPISRILGPLPESDFIATARDSILEPRKRVTTASARGSLRGRGRGRSTATREPSRSTTAAATQAAEQDSSTRSRGKGKKRAAHAASTGGAGGSRGRKKSKAAHGSASGSAQVGGDEQVVGTGESNTGYNTGPGSAYYLLFGNDQQTRSTEIPDLNFASIPDLHLQEIPMSQNAPPAEDHDVV